MSSPDRFEIVVRDHYEALFRFAMSLTRRESDAWDLTQQTFYVWAEKGHQLRDISRVKSWLFTTLHRAFLMAQRRQNRFTHHDLETVADQLPAVPPQRIHPTDHSQVLLALSKVDQTFQAALSLFYLEDFSYKEIALILRIPVGTVKSRISRGITRLREILSEDDVSAPVSVERGLSPMRVPEPVGDF